MSITLTWNSAPLELALLFSDRDSSEFQYRSDTGVIKLVIKHQLQNKKTTSGEPLYRHVVTLSLHQFATPTTFASETLVTTTLVAGIDAVLADAHSVTEALAALIGDNAFVNRMIGLQPQ